MPVSLLTGDPQLLSNIFFGMAGIGILVDLTSGDSGTIASLSIIVFALGGLLIVMLVAFSRRKTTQDDSDKHLNMFQMLAKGISLLFSFIIQNGPIMAMMALISWYLSIFRQNYSYILSKEMPASWYTFSGLIVWIIAIQMAQLWHFMRRVIHKLDLSNNMPENLQTAYKAYIGVEGLCIMIGTVVLAWLILFEYIIANYYRVDG